MSFNQPHCRWLIGVVVFASLALNVFFGVCLWVGR